MDELAAAAAAASISVDEGTEEEQQLDSTVEAHAAAEVLRAIDANAGDGQDEGHATGQEQPPDEVPLDVLTRRAQTMFSGITGAVVASGDLAGTAAPTYALVSDVSDVIEALPGKLFDRAHRQGGAEAQGRDRRREKEGEKEG